MTWRTLLNDPGWAVCLSQDRADILDTLCEIYPETCAGIDRYVEMSTLLEDAATDGAITMPEFRDLKNALADLM